MAEITLTQGYVALVDDKDLELVNKHKWHAQRIEKKVYACANIRNATGKCTKIYLHRLVMNPPVGMVVDHKSGDALDNRRDNLRVCTTAQNCAAKLSIGLEGTSSIYRGVSSFNDRWKAQLRCNGQTLYFGTYDTQEEAARVRDAAAKKYHGEFAVLNFPEAGGNN